MAFEQHDQWPPRSWRQIYDRYKEWAAWYSGNPNRLAHVYSALVYTPSPQGRFWAKEVRDERRTMIHVPLASDIAGTGADLVFGDRPDIKIPEAHEMEAPEGAIETQERLSEIMRKNDTYSLFLEMAESAAALGGCFLKINWSHDLADYPLITVAQADSAIPRFRWGKLNSVTFYRKLREATRWGKTVVLRHVEHRERGLVQNRLFAGSASSLGKELELENDPETQDLEYDIETGIDDLLVRYVPNKKPNRYWRSSHLGQSDFAGTEGLMDSLDEVYTSWMRDLRLGKGRIMVPEQYLDVDQEEEKFYFDEDKQVYTPMSMGPAGEEGQGITLNQFSIRTEEHKNTALELIERIVSAAGFAPQSFGLRIEGRAESGIALKLREGKSFKTKDKKQRHWRRPIEETLQLALRVDRRVFNNSNINPDYRPSVQFGEAVPEDTSQLAESLQRVEQAVAASVETKVRWLHPDWNEQEIKEEVDKIKEEQNIGPVEDPMKMEMP